MAAARTNFAHPLHGLLLAFPIALFASALASDVTYLKTEVVQWSHFSAWLIAGAELFGGLVLLWAIIDFIRFRKTAFRTRALIYVVLVAAMWIGGLLNSFQHSRDGWSSVGTFGLLLSIITTALALAAGWIAYSATSVSRPIFAGDVK